MTYTCLCKFGSLIEDMAFWPQVVGGQPVLSEPKRGILADMVVGMFLGQFGREGE